MGCHRRGGWTLTETSQPRRRETAAGLLTDLLEQHLDPSYAVAAKRREVEPPTRRAKRSGALARSLILLVIGVLLATAFAQASADAPEATRVRAALAKDARDKAALTDRLQRQAAQLRTRVAAERAAALAGSEVGARAQEQLAGIEMTAALVPVRGPGLIVTVGDAAGTTPNPVTGDAPPAEPDDAGQVQDRDLAQIVNALWASGAEAISVDGQRLSPTSTIRAAGEAILVDFRPVSSPYEIKAIGHADQMQALFTDSAIGQAFATFVQLYGLRFAVHAAKSVTVPGAPATTLKFAVPGASP